MDRTRYKQSYSDFVGVDLSSDPSEVSRNRLAYAVNMWRDYESSRRGCIETFPGYRAAAKIGKRIYGIYNYRFKNGMDYLIVHAGRDLYAFKTEELAAVGGVLYPEDKRVLIGDLAENHSTGFLFNNRLYILDGQDIFEVHVELDEVGIPFATASEIEGYIPLTYFDGKPYEQRNMLSDYAYEVVLPSKIEKNVGYAYSDTVGNEPELETRVVSSVSNDGTDLRISAPNLRVNINTRAFSRVQSLERVQIECKEQLIISTYAFEKCKSLKYVGIFVRDNIYSSPTSISILDNAFDGCDNLEKIYIYSDDPDINTSFGEGVASKVVIVDSLEEIIVNEHNITELAEAVEEVRDYSNDSVIGPAFYSVIMGSQRVGEKTLQVVKSVVLNGDSFPNGIKVKLKVYPNHFSAVAGADTFFDGNLDYKKTGEEAIKGCTKSAVFDGRIFLTGNPELPNTIFYSQRNLTGASDPTYFGAYNYINDGVGNNPNVELLATPSYLMVLKNDTVQEGSIYYHTPADNTHSDQVIRNLLPRIYPSISGAAGIGSAGDTVPRATVCNFLDDPVFLSKRGLEAVGKETLNLERTVTHRSGNVDRLLIKEELSSAALAEWKGYLMILVNGSVYLADSRTLAQHPDGSYQYEWFYLSGIGAWESYMPRYRYCTEWPMTDLGVRLDECVFETHPVGDVFKLSERSEYAGESTHGVAEITVYGRRDGEDEYEAVKLYEVGGYRGGDGEYVGGYVVEQIDGEMRGEGVFYPADKMAVVGERLFFGTENGYLLCVNSDMRDGEGILPRDAYTFNGVAYESGCATRLDDCGQLGLAKCTVPGTTVAEFKMMPGSRCRVNVSLNGRDWKELFSGAVGSTRFDFGDLDFSNFAFTENESNITVLREMTRNFVRKQYYIYSDGYKEPFGLCGLTYQYYVKGKIRR